MENEPRFDDIMCSLRSTGKQPKGLIKETQKVMAVARKFNDEITRLSVLALDRKMHEEPDYLPWDFVKTASDRGFYTMFMPRFFGGGGYHFYCMNVFSEEIGSVCAAMVNLIGVHYLGYAALALSWNMRLIDQISREVINGEKTGKPCLLSFAMTEPDAGTVSQKVEFMDTGSLACHAKKVPGGYVVNGTKIFISCGHLSTWHMLFVYTDLAKASEIMVILAVKTGAKGFSFGKKEKKMGQKASLASELVFQDCFIPDEYVLLDKSQIAHLSKSPRQITEQILAGIWGASRMGVGALGTSSARGAFEQALRFASENRINNELLINYEWCQNMLAEMYITATVARLSYLESGYANSLDSTFGKLTSIKPFYYAWKYTPRIVFDLLVAWFFKFYFTTKLLRKFFLIFKKIPTWIALTAGGRWPRLWELMPVLKTAAWLLRSWEAPESGMISRLKRY
jgi:alkylation response protein AidB-like acyl-CoA dehydrogenase